MLYDTAPGSNVQQNPGKIYTLFSVEISAYFLYPLMEA